MRHLRHHTVLGLGYRVATVQIETITDQSHEHFVVIVIPHDKWTSRIARTCLTVWIRIAQTDGYFLYELSSHFTR